jgi:predicted nucleic acid-binding Zn ribbon protein
MESIKSILGTVLKDIEKQQRQLPEDNLEDLWAKCVEKKALRHTKVSFFKSGRIYVNVENPGWLYELNINREEILNKLQKKSKNKVKDIKLKVGDIKNGN